MAHTILHPDQSDKKDKIRDRLVIGVFHHFEFPSKYRPYFTKDSNLKQLNNSYVKLSSRLISDEEFIHILEWKIQYAVIYKGYKVFNREQEPNKGHATIYQCKDRFSRRRIVSMLIYFRGSC